MAAASTIPSNPSPSAPGPFRPSSATRRRRPLGLVILVPLLALSTLNALRVGLTEPERLQALIPALGPVGLRLYLAAAGLILVALVGLWRLRAWGLWLSVGVTAAVIALDGVHGVWLHALVSLVSQGLILWAVRPAWPLERSL